MTNPITIPPAALEAAAREEYEVDRAASLDDYPSWEELSERMRKWRINRMSAACLAMLKNWPGATYYTGKGVIAQTEPEITLPLQEPSDADK